MKKLILLSISLITVLVLASCESTVIQAGSPTADSKTYMEHPTSSEIHFYADVRDMDLTNFQPIPDEKMIESLWFNKYTKWPDQVSSHTAEDILEKGKNPGLGVKELHTQGITGEGITVAIIDQNLILDHPEFAGKIVKYFDTGSNRPEFEGSMHAPAVTSLLVGNEIGTAPGAKVYFTVAPSWTGDAKYFADALNWIIEENEKLAAGEKIRVVSVSAAPSGEGSPFTKNNDAWEKAYERATEAGILVLDCTSTHGLTEVCILDLNDPEDVSKCIPGYPGQPVTINTDHIYIPNSHRSTAEQYSINSFSYQYTGVGGRSWTIPYLAGVLAMGWQLNPDLSNEQIIDLVFQSAYVNKDGAKIIDPKAFIEMVKNTTD